MNFDLETIQKLTAFLTLGDAAVGIVAGIIAKVAAARARGRALTQDELHAIALEAQAEFDALPLPAAQIDGAG